MKRITILLAMLLLVAAGCASESGSSAEASEAAATEEATPEPTPTDEPSADETVGAIPSFDVNGDPELAGRFPDTVGGQPINVQSFRGDTFMAGGGSDPSFTAFLDSVGAELNDVSVAFGGAMVGEDVLSVGAFRVLGANEGQLETEFLAASQTEGDIAGLEETSVGGKDVWTAGDPAMPGLSMFIYVKDDTVYFLTGSEEQAAEILAALP